MSDAGLKEDAFGRKRTAYSFRHTYASSQIRKGTDIYTLAINMRTSVRMIEMYYSDVVPDEMAKQLEVDTNRVRRYSSPSHSGRLGDVSVRLLLTRELAKAAVRWSDLTPD